LPNPSQHIPIYLESFPVIRTASAKIAVFTYRSPHFRFPWRRPCDITQYVAWMERQFNACQSPRSIYLSIFNSFRVIRCLTQRVSPKIAIFTTFCFPWDAPGAITLNVVSMERELDAYKLSRRMYPSNYKRFSDRARYWSKIVIFFHIPFYSTPPLGEFPSEYYHPVWCGKTRMVWLFDGEKNRRYLYFFWHNSRT